MKAGVVPSDLAYFGNNSVWDLFVQKLSAKFDYYFAPREKIISELLGNNCPMNAEHGYQNMRIIQKITPETGGLVDPTMLGGGRGGTTSGSNFNAVEKQAGER